MTRYQKLLKIYNSLTKKAGLVKIPKEISTPMITWAWSEFAKKIKIQAEEYLNSENKKITNHKYYETIFNDLSNKEKLIARYLRDPAEENFELETKIKDNLIKIKVDFVKNDNDYFKYNVYYKYGDEQPIILKEVSTDDMSYVVNLGLEEIKEYLLEIEKKLFIVNNEKNIDLYRLINLTKKYILDDIFTINNRTEKIFNFSELTNDPKLNNYKIKILMFFNSNEANEWTGLTNWSGMWDKRKNSFYTDNLYLIANSDIKLNSDNFKNSLLHIKEIISHELVHWKQDDFQERYDLKEKGGLPSNKIRDPLIDPWGYSDFDKKNKRQQHEIRDVEFYARLRDEVQIFKQKYGNASQKIKNFALAKTVDKGYPEDYDYSILYNLPPETFDALPSEPREFFKVLKEKAPDKYKKAVKEFYKAINE